MSTGDTPWQSPARDSLLRHILGASSRRAMGGPYERAALASVHALARHSGVAYSWVHTVVGRLREAGLLKGAGDLHPQDIEATYRWWAEHRRPSRGYGLLVQDPLAALRFLNSTDGAVRAESPRFLVTADYAENSLAGHLFARRMDVYVKADQSEGYAAGRRDDAPLGRARKILVDEIGAQLGGTNFRLLPGPYRMFREATPQPEHRNVNDQAFDVAPVPQVIVDLIHQGASAGEAASLLIRRYYR